MFLKSSILLCLFAQLSQASKNRDFGTGPSRAHQLGRQVWQTARKAEFEEEEEKSARRNQLSCQTQPNRHRYSTVKRKSDELLLLLLLLSALALLFETGKVLRGGGKGLIWEVGFFPPTTTFSFLLLDSSAAISGSADLVWATNQSCCIWNASGAHFLEQETEHLIYILWLQQLLLHNQAVFLQRFKIKSTRLESGDFNWLQCLRKRLLSFFLNPAVSASVCAFPVYCSD